MIYRFKRSNSGMAMIEFAFVAPVLILIMLGVIEFGIYFLRYQTASRAAAITAASIQTNPSDATIQTLAKNSGLAFANLAAAPNYICAMSYTTQNAASGGLCTSGQWKTTAPGGVAAGTPYYIAVVAFIKQQSFTPGFNNLPDIKVSSVFTVGGNANLPICTTNQVLTSTDGKTFTCSNPFPKITYVSGTAWGGSVPGPGYGVAQSVQCPATTVVIGGSCDLWVSNDPNYAISVFYPCHVAGNGYTCQSYNGYCTPHAICMAK